LVLRSIQYLRGAAALLVVLYHVYVQLFRLGYTGPLPHCFSIGVDIFFVISGFIMWYTTVDGKLTTTEFWRHRIIRIVPLYWLVTSFYVFVLLVSPGIMQSAQFNLFHIITSYLFIPSPHPSSPEWMWPLVVPGWTLNYEMFFYLLFGLCLVIPLQWRAATIVALLACLVSLQALNPPTNSIIGFYSSSIVLEFAFGVLLGYMYSRKIVIPRVLSLAMILGGIAAALSFSGSLPLSQRAIDFGVPALLIVAGAVFFERSHGVREIGLPKLLGDASYSIYLTHGMMLSAYGQFWRKFHLPSVSQPIDFLLFSVLGVIMASIFGITIYKLIERPMVSALAGRFKRTPKKTYRPSFNR
jgi:exopolysaccharide production protein ExoZ